MHTTTSKAKNSYGKKPRRKGYYKRSDRRLARIAKQVVKNELDNEMELKAFTTTPEVLGQPISNVGQIFNLTATMPQGTGNGQRIGTKISTKSLFVRMEVNANGTASYDNLRVIILRWYGELGPSVSDILELTSSGLIRHLSQLNQEKGSQYRILYDNTYLVSDFANSDIPAVQIDKFYVKSPGDAEWNTAGSAVKGHLFLLAISDAILNNPELSFIPRVRYTDA